MKKHALPAQVQPVPMQTDSALDVALAAKQVNQCFLIQACAQKRAPVLEQIKHRLPQHAARWRQIAPLLRDCVEATARRRCQACGDDLPRYAPQSWSRSSIVCRNTPHAGVKSLHCSVIALKQRRAAGVRLVAMIFPWTFGGQKLSNLPR